MTIPMRVLHWIVGFVAVAALGLTPVGLGSRRGPPVPQLVTDALTQAQNEGSFRYRLRATFTATVDESRLDPVLAELGPEVIRAWAARPLVLMLEGVVGPDALTARGTLKGAGRQRSLDLRDVGGRLYVRESGSWYATAGIWRWLQTEMFGGLVPLELCVRGSPYGCKALDLTYALRNGRLGRLVIGRVVEGPSVRGEATWKVTGRLSARQLMRLKTDGYGSEIETRTYRPYERSSRVVLLVGKRSRVPARLELSYRLDREGLREHLRGQADDTAVVARSARIAIDTWDWGRRLAVERPAGSRPMTRPILGRLIRDFFRVLYLHY